MFEYANRIRMFCKKTNSRGMLFGLILGPGKMRTVMGYETISDEVFLSQS